MSILNQDGESKSEPTSKQHKGEHTLFSGDNKAIYGGLLTVAVAFGGQWLTGVAFDGYEARQLLEASASSALYFGSAVVTASATIIALMLTMIGLTKQADSEFDTVFFKRIQRIGQFSTAALTAGVLLLLFLSIPLEESDKIPTDYFKTIYYILITYVAGVSGLVVAIVLMLLNAMNSLIDVVSPTADEEVEKAKERDEEESKREEEDIN